MAGQERRSAGTRVRVQIKTSGSEGSTRREWLMLTVRTPDMTNDGKLRVLLTNDNDAGGGGGGSPEDGNNGDAAAVICFYSVAFTEADYRRFREDQGLLVDMAAFAPMIARMLEMCEADESGQRFFVTLESASGGGAGGQGMDATVFLSFVEINAFRKLVHLKLKMQSGTDAQIRRHLSQQLTSLKSSFSDVTRLYKQCQRELAEQQSTSGKMQEEIERLRSNSSEKEASLTQQMGLEVNREREKGVLELNQARANFQAERNRLNEEHAALTRRLQNQVASLEYENKDLSERRHRNEASLLGLSDEVKRQKEEVARLKSELISKRDETKKVGEGARELDQTVQRLQAQISALEQERTRLSGDLTLQVELLKSTSEAKAKLEQSLHDKTLLVTKRETAVKTVTQELVKANEAIKKLQEENRRQNQKVKLSHKIVSEQEKLIAKKEAECEDARSQLKEQSEANRDWIGSKELLNKELDIKDAEIENLKKAAKTSDTVIQWLNKQLTAAKVRDPGLKIGPPPANLSSVPQGLALSATTPGRSQSVQPSGKSLVASTPIVGGGRDSDDENKSGNAVLDPKYLQPIKKKSMAAPIRNGGGGGSVKQTKSKSAKAASSAVSATVAAESVYFS